MQDGSDDGFWENQESSNILQKKSPTKIPFCPLKYEQFCNEMRCPICRNILEDPVFLPCNHCFCHKCIRLQMANELLGNKKTQCAECKMKFNHRNLKRVKKFDAILSVFN